MTRDLKFRTIQKRLGQVAETFLPAHLSILILMEYLEIMFENGIITEGEIKTTELGKKAVALCEEFDWIPSDEEIVDFCQHMVEPSNRTSFLMMLRSMRDDKEKFLKNAKKHVGY